MNLQLNWTTIILALVIAQSLFSAGLLLFAGENKRPNRILALLIFLLSLWLLDDLMRIGLIYRQQPRLYFMPIFYSFAFGPLLWLYVKSLVNADFRPLKVHLLHFIPVIIQGLLYWSLAFSSYATKYWYWTQVHQPYTYRLEFDGTWISLLIYGWLSFRQIQYYQTWVSANFSETSRIRLNWLKTVLAALLVLCLQWFIEIVMRDGYNVYFNYDLTVQLLGILILILAIGGLRQSSLNDIRYQPAIEKETSAFQTDPVILEKIKAAMEADLLYLNPTLTLAELAAHIETPVRNVSRHINEGLDRSFNDYVNRYRVQGVIRRIDAGDLQKFTLLAIAQNCGFNSKTSFNRIFKEVTGMPPSAYTPQVPNTVFGT